MPTPHVTVRIDLGRVVSNAVEVRRRCGVPIKPVIKADAYGLGATRIAAALFDVAEEYCYFSLLEAREVQRPGLVLGPPAGHAEEFEALRVRPSISTADDAKRFGRVPAALEIDSGMQRFGCDLDQVQPLLAVCQVVDIWTHACSLASVERFLAATRGLDYPRHAACSALLDEPRAFLDSVRPGVALYRSAMRVSTRLVVARPAYGPAGYTGFSADHVGVILVGYGQGLRPAPVRVNGKPQRMLEVGMNSTFVTLDSTDRAGDEVVLLGDGLTEAEIAGATPCREHEVLCRYGRLGERTYYGP